MTLFCLNAPEAVKVMLGAQIVLSQAKNDSEVVQRSSQEVQVMSYREAWDEPKGTAGKSGPF